MADSEGLAKDNKIYVDTSNDERLPEIKITFKIDDGIAEKSIGKNDLYNWIEFAIFYNSIENNNYTLCDADWESRIATCALNISKGIHDSKFKIYIHKRNLMSYGSYNDGHEDIDIREYEVKGLMESLIKLETFKVINKPFFLRTYDSIKKELFDSYYNSLKN